MFVPDKSSVEVQSKVFEVLFLRKLAIVYVDLWTRVFAGGECDLGWLGFTGLNSLCVWGVFIITIFVHYLFHPFLVLILAYLNSVFCISPQPFQGKFRDDTKN
jgi:hypothetical protein